MLPEVTRVVSILILLAMGSTHAAQPTPGAAQEETLESRLLRPNHQKASIYQGKTFTGTALFQQKKFSVQPYGGAGAYTTQPYHIQGYQTSKAALGDKKPVLSQTQYQGTKSSTAASGTFNANALATSTYGQANQSTSVKPGVVVTPTTKVEAGAQGRLDGMTKEIKNKLTIDEIRELLNKPK